MRHDFSKILTLYYIAINLEISDFEMSDKFLDPSIASHEVLLYAFFIDKKIMFCKNFRIFNMILLISKSFFKPYFIQRSSYFQP